MGSLTRHADGSRRFSGPALLVSITRCEHRIRMKPIHTARHVTEAHLICGYLQSQGVNALVRGEYLAGGIGELPAGLCKVWIADDAEFARADRLLQAFLRGEAARLHDTAGWRCPQCNEDIEGQFTDCWQCGAPRPPAMG